MNLFLCQAGFEEHLASEIENRGIVPVEMGAGWVRTEKIPESLSLAFPHLILSAAVQIKAESVNALANGIYGFFSNSVRSERINDRWPFWFQFCPTLEGAGRRVSSISRVVEENLRKSMSRLAKLSYPGQPPMGTQRGLFIYFTGYSEVWATRTAIFFGQRRMADDDLAPSRSYLKVEEAYGVIQSEPGIGQTVVDLGAAPGGWSYSAAKRGANVVAVDNGPLKGGALENPTIEHLREDAFRYEPREQVDWLFCDLVEEPHHVIELCGRWLERRWCRQFVVNLKFGRVDPIKLLVELRAPQSPFERFASDVQVRHLYHDREEFTVTGKLKP